ncbi:hypothetical protein AAMO2058_001294900 [Amorphochlora amoebiformis]
MTWARPCIALLLSLVSNTIAQTPKTTFNLELTDGVPFETIPELFSEEFCREFIKESNTHEWIETNDSVDSLPQYTIDILDHGRKEDPKLMDLLDSKMDDVLGILRKRFPNQARNLDWIFLRRL